MCYIDLKLRFVFYFGRQITLPGEYNVAGAQALYERYYNLEKIRIPGPIREPILISVSKIIL